MNQERFPVRANPETSDRSARSWSLASRSARECAGPITSLESETALRAWPISVRARVLLKACFSAGLLVYLGTKMDRGAVSSVLASANWPLLLAAVVMHFGTVALSLLRWSVLVASFGIQSPLRQLLRFLLIGCYFNLFLPTSVGGDVARSYYLARTTDNWMPTTLTTTFMDRFIGLFALLLVASVCTAIHPIPIQGYSILPILLITLTGFIVSALVLLNDRTHEQLRRIVQRFGRETAGAGLDSLVASLRGLLHRPMSLLAAIGLSVMIQFVVIGTTWVAASALALDAPFLSFFVFVPLINLAMIFPLTINGIGFREGVYYLLFSEIGIPVEQSVLLSLLMFLIMNVPSLVGGVIYMAPDGSPKRTFSDWSRVA